MRDPLIHVQHATMHVENGGKKARSTARSLAAYANAGNQWRLIAWQFTRRPEA